MLCDQLVLKDATQKTTYYKKTKEENTDLSNLRL